MTNHKKVLGRGLEALIPQAQKRDVPGAGFEIPLEKVSTNPYQPRKRFDEAAIEQLAASIREHGVVQPVIVTRKGEGFQLLAGERRYRAAQRAGLASIPAIVKEALNAKDSLEIALIENIQREDLNAIEEAVAYQQLHEEFGLTQDEIARRVGKERSTVANFLRLLRLPENVKARVASGELSMGHARALLGVADRKKIAAFAERVIRRGLNVRQTEELVSEAPKPKKKEKPKDVFTRDAEEKLTRALRTKVAINRKRRGGVVQIHFTTEDELIRLFEDLSHGRKR